MTPARVLILGGTGEARELAEVLDAAGVAVVSSLAGRVARPRLPPGEVRSGGFGGADGLASFLAERAVGAVVDATHPFAARISANAVAAAEQAGVPLLRLERPGWAEHPRARAWTWVPDADAARAAAAAYEHPFLTTGRQSLASFLPWADRAVLARVVDPPELALPQRWTLITARGPYARADEQRLMTGAHTDVLLTKDSGGTLTAAKLDAAGDLGIPVVVIARPPRPAGVPTVSSVAEAAAWSALG